MPETRKITDRLMSTLQPGQTVYDSEIRGFRVRCLPSGTISFGLQRTTADSKREHIKLGLFPEVSPGQARKLAQSHTGRIAAGDNPAAQQRADTERAKVTVNFVLDRWLADHARSKVKAKGRKLSARYFERFVRPAFGDVVIYDLGREPVFDMLSHVAHKVSNVTADAVLIALRGAFNYWRDVDPKFVTTPIVSKRMRKINPVDLERNRYLSIEEIRDLWMALDRISGEHPIMTALVRTLLLTGCRLREIANLHTSEIDGDDLIVPKERCKGGRYPHLVPLVPALRRVIPDRQGYVFAAPGSSAAPMPDGRVAVNNEYRFKRLLDDTINDIRRRDGRPPIQPWRFHDLRRTARTVMARLGVPGEIAERCLGHVQSSIQRTYDVHEYRDEKAEALTKLAEYVALITRPDPDNIVTLHCA
jgi:integrase